MKFEFDPTKSQKNKEKHGIDFVAGQEIFADPRAIRHIPETAHDGEAYWKDVGQAQGKLWAAIYVQRNDTIRLVSIRRAREDEREQYEIE